MARIPIEQNKKGSPWWLWLIGLLVLGSLIWLVAALFNPDGPAEGVVEGSTEGAAPVAPTEIVVIANPEAIRRAPEPAALVGSEVQLDSLYIISVPGDNVLVAGRVEMLAYATGYNYNTNAEETGADLGTAEDTTNVVGALDSRILVVLRANNVTGPETAEGSTDFEQGQMVRITGQVQELDEQMTQGLDLPNLDLQEIAQNGLYVEADQVTVTEEARDDL